MKYKCCTWGLDGIQSHTDALFLPDMEHLGAEAILPIVPVYSEDMQIKAKGHLNENR